jgi:hypothetical protein
VISIDCSGALPIPRIDRFKVGFELAGIVIIVAQSRVIMMNDILNVITRDVGINFDLHKPYPISDPAECQHILFVEPSTTTASTTLMNSRLTDHVINLATTRTTGFPIRN